MISPMGTCVLRRLTQCKRREVNPIIRKRPKTAAIIPSVPKKASPQIPNKKCFSPRVTVRECKNLYLVKVIELRVIHLLR